MIGPRRSAPAAALVSTCLVASGCLFAPEAEVVLEPVACDETDDAVSCPFTTVVFRRVLATRQVHLQLPLGEAPAAGWPTVLFFQGSFDSAEGVWAATADHDFGSLHQARLLSHLLAAGFAVIAPETSADGFGFWGTNVWPTTYDWESGEDHGVILGILEALDRGELGPLDGSRLYATGISSGGYMTSRMALSYPGRMRALAIQSASWATCAGPLCIVGQIPTNHPPTLFLHGDADAIVSIETMRPYAEALEQAGVTTAVVEAAEVGHEWLETAPDDVPAWFMGSP